jgi:hypothetical protein
MKVHEDILESIIICNATSPNQLGVLSFPVDQFYWRLVNRSSVCMKFKSPCKTAPIYIISWCMLHMV